MRALVYLVAVISLTGAWAVLTPAGPAPAHAATSQVVISQLYGGGGNSGAPYSNDFVELFNRGSAPASLGGWSIQYASATGTTNFSASPLVALPDVSLPSGGYFLVQLAGGTNGAALPAPDATGTPNLAAASGKVVLAATTIGLACNGGSNPCAADQLALIVDLVGYGSANFFEGSAAAPTLSNTTAAIRREGGCTDTDDNAADFTAGLPSPRNAQSPAHACPDSEPEPTPTPTATPTPIPTPSPFDFAGFGPPLANPPAVNSAKAGSSVVLHFSLGGDHGLDMIADGHPLSTARTCATDESAGAEPATGPGRSGLSYDPATDTYTFVWKTDRAWSGTCRRLTLKLVDGSYHHADVSFR